MHQLSAASTRRLRLPSCGVGLLAALALAACTSSLGTRAPAGFDLSGDWLLDEGASDAGPDVAAIRRREDRKAVRGPQSGTGASAAFVVQDFPVLSAASLRIEQSRDSMGIRYDDSVYRDISWGQRQRDFWLVRAGWDADALVVRSTRGAVKGVETMTLERNGSVLRVAVRVDAGGEEVLAERVYRRR